MDENNTTPEPIVPEEPTTEPIVSEEPVADAIINDVPESISEPITPPDPMIEPSAPAYVTTPNDTPVASDAAQKSHKGLKIGLIATTAVLLAGGLGGGVFAYVHTRPENIMTGAFSNFLNAKSIAVSGQISYSNNSEYSSFRSLNVKLEETASKTEDVTAGAKATFTAVYRINDKDKEFSITTDEVFMRDGVFYFKLDGIEKIIGNLLDMALETLSYSLQTNYAVSKCGGASTKCIEPQTNCVGSSEYPYTNCLSEPTDCLDGPVGTDCVTTKKLTREDLPEDMAQIFDAVEELASDVDGTWWKISVSDLLEYATEEDYLTPKQAKKYEEAYSCFVEQIHEEINKSGQYAEIFKKYPFVSINRDANAHEKDGTVYQLSLDVDKLTDFILDSSKVVDIDAFNSCLQKVYSDGGVELSEPNTNREEVKQGLESSLKDLPEIRLKINDWNHQLLGISASKSAEEASASVELNFSYPTKSNLSAPNDARSVTKLRSSIMSIYDAMFGTYADYDEDYEDYDIEDDEDILE